MTTTRFRGQVLLLVLVDILLGALAPVAVGAFSVRNALPRIATSRRRRANNHYTALKAASVPPPPTPTPPSMMMRDPVYYGLAKRAVLLYDELAYLEENDSTVNEYLSVQLTTIIASLSRLFRESENTNNNNNNMMTMLDASDTTWTTPRRILSNDQLDELTSILDNIESQIIAQQPQSVGRPTTRTTNIDNDNDQAAEAWRSLHKAAQLIERAIMEEVPYEYVNSLVESYATVKASLEMQQQKQPQQQQQQQTSSNGQQPPQPQPQPQASFFETWRKVAPFLPLPRITTTASTSTTTRPPRWEDTTNVRPTTVPSRRPRIRQNNASIPPPQPPVSTPEAPSPGPLVTQAQPLLQQQSAIRIPTPPSQPQPPSASSTRSSSTISSTTDELAEQLEDFLLNDGSSQESDDPIETYFDSIDTQQSSQEEPQVVSRPKEPFPTTALSTPTARPSPTRSPVPQSAAPRAAPLSWNDPAVEGRNRLARQLEEALLQEDQASGDPVQAFVDSLKGNSATPSPPPRQSPRPPAMTSPPAPRTAPPATVTQGAGTRSSNNNFNENPAIKRQRDMAQRLEEALLADSDDENTDPVEFFLQSIRDTTGDRVKNDNKLLSSQRNEFESTSNERIESFVQRLRQIRNVTSADLERVPQKKNFLEIAGTESSSPAVTAAQNKQASTAFDPTSKANKRISSAASKDTVSEAPSVPAGQSNSAEPFYFVRLETPSDTETTKKELEMMENNMLTYLKATRPAVARTTKFVKAVATTATPIVGKGVNMAWTSLGSAWIGLYGAAKEVAEQALHQAKKQARKSSQENNDLQRLRGEFQNAVDAWKPIQSVLDNVRSMGYRGIDLPFIPTQGQRNDIAPGGISTDDLDMELNFAPVRTPRDDSEQNAFIPGNAPEAAEWELSSPKSNPIERTFENVLQQENLVDALPPVAFDPFLNPLNNNNRNPPSSIEANSISRPNMEQLAQQWTEMNRDKSSDPNSNFSIESRAQGVAKTGGNDDNKDCGYLGSTHGTASISEEAKTGSTHQSDLEQSSGKSSYLESLCNNAGQRRSSEAEPDFVTTNSGQRSQRTDVPYSAPGISDYRTLGSNEVKAVESLKRKLGSHRASNRLGELDPIKLKENIASLRMKLDLDEINSAVMREDSNASTGVQGSIHSYVGDSFRIESNNGSLRNDNAGAPPAWKAKYDMRGNIINENTDTGYSDTTSETQRDTQWDILAGEVSGADVPQQAQPNQSNQHGNDQAIYFEKLAQEWSQRNRDS